ncbi:MAG: hypothetical protein JXA46_18915 [Dehalococcoidales bacterium]|nr:hypothetical protein [Dehalococcoidales bacterium]
MVSRPARLKLLNLRRDLDIFIVMPDHIHGTINILKSGLAGSKPATTRPCNLSEIVCAIKTFYARGINQLRNTQVGHVWQ